MVLRVALAANVVMAVYEPADGATAPLDQREALEVTRLAEAQVVDVDADASLEAVV